MGSSAESLQGIRNKGGVQPKNHLTVVTLSDQTAGVNWQGGQLIHSLAEVNTSGMAILNDMACQEERYRGSYTGLNHHCEAPFEAKRHALPAFTSFTVRKQALLWLFFVQFLQLQLKTVVSGVLGWWWWSQHCWRLSTCQLPCRAVSLPGTQRRAGAAECHPLHDFG